MRAHKRSSVASTGVSSYGPAEVPASAVLPTPPWRMSVGPLTAAVLEHERGEERGDVRERRPLVEPAVLEEPGIAVEHSRRAIRARQPHDVEVARDVHQRP